MTILGGARRATCVGAACGSAAGLFWAGYLTMVGLAAERSLRQAPAPAPVPVRLSRFRILVPAHNEEGMIDATLDSLAQLDSPSDRVSIHVVADNCTDGTAVRARAHGVDVHERHHTDLPGKGAALAWLIDRLPEGETDDVFVVIDADTVVSPGLLNEFERAFAPGIVAIQGHYMVKDAHVGGHIAFRAAALAVRHLVRPAGRTALGGSSSLYGNAMAFRESTARRYPWSTNLTEDLEMSLRVMLDGHVIGYAPRAVVEAEMPDSLEGAVSQNERWEAGRLKVAIHYVPLLLRAARRGAHGRRWTYVDAAIDISLPPLTTVVGISALGGAGMVGAARGRVRRVGVVASALALGLQVAHVLHALHLADAPSEVRRSLVRAPAHMVWKSRLLTRVARRDPDTWIRTSRGDREVAA